jgi:hypothetical protein
MRNKPQVVVLCEDDQHFHFARKYLKLRGVERFIKKTAIPGRGSGAQFVIERYANELQAYRSCAGYLNIALVVFLDEDRQGSQARLRSLENVLQQAGMECRKENEKVAIFIPARNIQTWFHYLVEQTDVDETTDYKSRYLKGSYPTQSAKKLANDICPNGLPANAPASLQHACIELSRLSL